MADLAHTYNMKIKKLYDGIQEKERILEKICKEFSVKPFEVAFIGDDINDLELLKIVGFSAVPYDGHELVKKNPKTRFWHNCV